MAYTFGQEAGTDWVGLINNLVKSGSEVAVAALTGQETTAHPVSTPGAQAPLATTSSAGTSSMVILGLAAVLGLVLFMKLRKGR